MQTVPKCRSSWSPPVEQCLQDVATYIGLFLAIRSGYWYLRTACMKWRSLAFDHEHYYKMITPSRFALYATQSILTIFQQVHFYSVSGAGHGILLK